jgi:tetratricopeptide (TPR) repeat protein
VKCVRSADARYAHNRLGSVYLSQKRYPEAIEQFEISIKLDPKDPTDYDNLGLVYSTQQRYPEAIEQFEKAIKVDPKYAGAYLNLGNAYYALARYPEAIEQYKKSIEHDSSVAESKYNLGLAYVYTNNETAAMEQYEALKGAKSEYADKLLSEINKPQLAFTKQEDFKSSNQNWTRYYLSVTNHASFPNEMFAQSPDLPPCGQNPNSSRTWVDIFDGAGTRLQGFCALGSSADLAALWFALPKGQTHPASVFIVLNDRRENVEYKSSLTAIP